MGAVAREAAEVAAAFGRRLTYPDPVATAEAVARRTAANHSSMLQDVQRGAPTENDAICGAIVAAAEECGMSAPVNRTLWLLIGALEEIVESYRLDNAEDEHADSHDAC
jgi:2-dehydropantoate 2-reductase